MARCVPENLQQINLLNLHIFNTDKHQMHRSPVLAAHLKVDTFYPCLSSESMQVDKKYPLIFLVDWRGQRVM